MIAEGCGSYGSRGTVAGGTALWNATTALRKKMLRLAAHKLEAREDDLELAAGRIAVRGTDHSISFRELARAAKPGQPLPPGMEPGLDESSTFVVTDTVHPYGLHAALVEVDAGLGTVRVLKYLIAYDIGVAINPQLVEGQLVGAFAQGLGGALLEKLVYSEDGQLLTGSLMDYLMPTAMETPMDIEILLSEDAPSQHNAIGMKGAGEAGIVAVGAAIANAVEDALAPFAVRITRLPLTPSAIADLLRGSNRS
jgi:aerobic carbon-monoxide dehydrogenase large subunit